MTVATTILLIAKGQLILLLAKNCNEISRKTLIYKFSYYLL